MRATESRKGPRGFGEPTGGAEGSLALPWHLPCLQRNLHPCADKKEPFKKVTQKTPLALKDQCDRNIPVPKQTPVHACIYGFQKSTEGCTTEPSTMRTPPAVWQLLPSQVLHPPLSAHPLSVP